MCVSDDEQSYVVSNHETNDADPTMYDTPTERASINQLSVDALDQWLEQIRERRLKRVKQLEEIAKVRSDQVRLVEFLKLQRAYIRAKASLTKLDEQMKKVEEQVHKCRLLAMAAQLDAVELANVGQEDNGTC